MFTWLKKWMPRGLYGRAALILIVPIVTIQLVVSVVFIQRHFERVTEQMTGAVAVELGYLRRVIADEPDRERAMARALELAQALSYQIEEERQELYVQDQIAFWDLSGHVVAATLRAELDGVLAVVLPSDERRVHIRMETAAGPLLIGLDRFRVSASNPHQLLVMMIVTSILMTIVAYLFLRNQLRPIERLAHVASAFGRGELVPYRPRGATEVRAAGNAFLDMRSRIDRQIEQRTLMLSGVSHDLRTPLTRMKLGLSMLSDPDEAKDLLQDVNEMQRMVDAFLAFARGDAMEEMEDVDPRILLERAVENGRRAGFDVELAHYEGDEGALVRLRPMAVGRALDNLVSNGARHGTRVRLSGSLGARALRLIVEDDGPGIARERREEAMMPFVRLDASRDPNKGGGVGLGLSIAGDVARSHGGVLRLGESTTLGGVRAEMVLAR